MNTEPEITGVEQEVTEVAAIPEPAVVRPRPPRKPLGTGLHDLPSVWTLEASIEWLIEGFIPLGGITMLSAPSGAGKTWLAQAIAGCVAHGKPFLGLTTKRRKVVYLDRENPLSVVKHRLAALAVGHSDDFLIWGGWNATSPPDPNSPEWKTIITYAEQHHPVLILDSLIRFHTGDEQSAKETRDFMKFLSLPTKEPR